MNNTELIQEVKSRGFRIKIIHQRAWKGHSSEYAAKGGQTICSLKPLDGRYEIITVAKCSPKDQFVRKIGSRLALERARWIAVSLDEKGQV